MKFLFDILFNRLVIAAFVLSVLIVLGAYVGGQWLYKTDRDTASTSTVPLLVGVFTGEGVNSDGPNVQEYDAPDSNEFPSSSEWHEDNSNMPEPESVSEITDDEREAAMRRIRWELERIKELEAALPPLMLANPDQFRKELEEEANRVTMEAERAKVEAENLLEAALNNNAPDVLPELQDLESLFLRTAQLRRQLEEFHSQYPEDALIAVAIEKLNRMEARWDEEKAFAAKLFEKLNEKGVEFQSR